MIRESVLSLVGNLADDVEIIVGDDASPRQAEIKAAIADFVDRGDVRFIYHPVNGGWSANRNLLVAAARGEWVVLLGDDDRLKAGAVSRLRDWMARGPAADIYGFGYDVIDEDGSYVYVRKSPKMKVYEVPVTVGWEELFYFDALPMWSHHPFTMCFRREFGLANPYDKEAGIADDVLFLFKALQQGKRFAVIPESLFEWRRALSQGTGYSGLSGDDRKCHDGQMNVHRKLTADSRTTPEVRALIGTSVFLQRFMKIDGPTARRLASEAGPSSGGPFDYPKAGDPGTGHARSIPAQIWKVVRVVRVLGWGHVGNLIRYYIDMAHHGRNGPHQSGLPAGGAAVAGPVPDTVVRATGAVTSGCCVSSASVR